MDNDNEKQYLFTRKKLNKISSSFCLAKWNQVSLHLQNGRTHSCHHPGTHHIPLSEIESNPSAIHNTLQKKSARKKMQEGERPKECSYCWTIEDLPGEQISDRYIKSTNSTWVSEDDIEKYSKSDSMEDINPSYVEISFSNTCNLKCSYCSPVHSTKWTQEIKKNGPYKIFNYRDLNSLDYLKDTKSLPIESDEFNPYLDAFWKWWPDLNKDLKVLRITGGEPLLDSSTFKVLDEICDNPKPDLELSINSNLAIKEDLLEKFIIKIKEVYSKKACKHFTIFTSIDGHGKQAEYGRHGLDYNLWLKNLRKCLTELPHTHIVIMCTTNIFSVTSIDKLVKEVHDLKKEFSNQYRKVPLSIDFSILRYPGFLNLSLLPNSFAKKLEETLNYIKENNYEKKPELKTGFSNLELIKFKRVIDFLIDGPKEAEDYNEGVSKADLTYFIEQHDERRKTDFMETFPELKNFFLHCKATDLHLLQKYHPDQAFERYGVKREEENTD